MLDAGFAAEGGAAANPAIYQALQATTNSSSSKVMSDALSVGLWEARSQALLHQNHQPY